MKQANYSGRPRGRSSDRHKQPPKKMNGDMRDGNQRGNPQQSIDKYLSLARDAASLGDPVSAENFYQYADHYYRLASANRAAQSPAPLITEKDDPLPPSVESPPKEKIHRPREKRIES